MKTELITVITEPKCVIYIYLLNLAFLYKRKVCPMVEELFHGAAFHRRVNKVFDLKQLNN
jgi:hypothetical protein